MLNVGAQDHLFFLVVCIAFRGNNAGSADAHTHTPPNSSVFAACVCVVVYARTCQVDRELWRYYLEKVNGDPWEYQNGDKAPPLCA